MLHRANLRHLLRVVALELLARALSLHLSQLGPGDRFSTALSLRRRAAVPEWMRPVRRGSIGPPRKISAVGIPSLEQFQRGFKLRPGMVLHVTLEYTVPHMGFTTALTYGGLGKVCMQPAPGSLSEECAKGPLGFG